MAVEQQELFYNGKTYYVPLFSAEGGIHLTPQVRDDLDYDRDNPIVSEMDTLWDLSRFKIPHTPLSFGQISEAAQLDFLVPITESARVLDMPIRFPGTDYRLPRELGYLRKALQECIDVYESVHPNPSRGYCYLTFDHKLVRPDVLMREAPAHVDGFQGARWLDNPRAINNSITIDSCLPTVYYPMPFDFDALDIAKHDFFWEMNNQIAKDNSAHTWKANVFDIAWMNGYCVHRGAEAPHAMERRWMRLSWEDRIFDRLGNAHNPLFEYDWEMVERDIEQLHLEAFDKDSDPSLRVFPHQNPDGTARTDGRKTKPMLRSDAVQ